MTDMHDPILTGLNPAGDARLTAALQPQTTTHDDDVAGSRRLDKHVLLSDVLAAVDAEPEPDGHIDDMFHEDGVSAFGIAQRAIRAAKASIRARIEALR